MSDDLLVGIGTPVSEVVPIGGVDSDGNATVFKTNSRGVLQVDASGVSPITLSFAVVNISSSGDTVVISDIPDTTVKIYGISLLIGGDTDITLKDEDDNLYFPLFSYSEGAAIVLDPQSSPRFTCTTGDGFILTSSNAVPISGNIYYTQE